MIKIKILKESIEKYKYNYTVSDFLGVYSDLYDFLEYEKELSLEIRGLKRRYNQMLSDTWHKDIRISYEEAVFKPDEGTTLVFGTYDNSPDKIATKLEVDEDEIDFFLQDFRDDISELLDDYVTDLQGILDTALIGRSVHPGLMAKISKVFVLATTFRPLRRGGIFDVSLSLSDDKGNFRKISLEDLLDETYIKLSPEEEEKVRDVVGVTF